MSTLHVGDIGSVIRLTLKENGTVVDISGASTKQIKLQKPDGTSVTKTASFTDNGTDGQLQYSTQSGDLSVAGRWYAQAYVVLGSWSGHSEKVELVVEPAF